MRSYSVLQDQESSNELTLQEHFSQTFTTGKAFDHIALWVANWDGAANDSIYDVTVLDESGVAVVSGQVIGAEAPCMSAYTIAFDRIVPERTQTYTIEVTLRIHRKKWKMWIWLLLCMRKIKGKLESKTPCIYVCFMLGLDLI